MRKVVATEYLTLDGVMEDPAWTMSYWNDEIAQFKLDELMSSDTLLLGRVTYQGFASAWPERTDEQGFADRMNSLPKYVASRTLDAVEWNNSRLLKENVAEEVARLKQEPGQDILIYGSGELVNSLLEHNLVDELRLMVYPLVLGTGKPLFKHGSMPLKLKPIATRSFDSGVTLLSFAPAEQN